MVWGAFCGELISHLYFVPAKAKVDSKQLIPFWHKACEQCYGWAIVMEDGAPGHKGYATASREINGLDSLPWPPQSPDLNLIEASWGDLECELGEKYGLPPKTGTNTSKKILHSNLTIHRINYVVMWLQRFHERVKLYI